MKDKSKLEVLAVVPARGGSKGVPGKNIRPLGEVPLVVYAIRAALEAGNINRVVVSTEDEQIAQVAREAGAEVPFLRPAEHAGDHAHLQDALYHLLDTLAETEDYRPDIQAIILPTFPFIGGANVGAVVQTCLDGSLSAAVAAPWRRRLEELYYEQGARLVHLLDAEGEPRPDCKPGDLMLAQTAVTAQYAFPRGARPHEDYTACKAWMDDLHARGITHTSQQCRVVDDEIALLDIDTEEDFRLAEAVLEKGLGPEAAYFRSDAR